LDKAKILRNLAKKDTFVGGKLTFDFLDQILMTKLTSTELNILLELVLFSETDGMVHYVNIESYKSIENTDVFSANQSFYDVLESLKNKDIIEIKSRDYGNWTIFLPRNVFNKDMQYINVNSDWLLEMFNMPVVAKKIFLFLLQNNAFNSNTPFKLWDSSIDSILNPIASNADNKHHLNKYFKKLIKTALQAFFNIKRYKDCFVLASKNIKFNKIFENLNKRKISKAFESLSRKRTSLKNISEDIKTVINNNYPLLLNNRCDLKAAIAKSLKLIIKKPTENTGAFFNTILNNILNKQIQQFDDAKLKIIMSL